MRAYGERNAQNSPLQGSAADLMKLAMVRVQRSLKATTPSATLGAPSCAAAARSLRETMQAGEAEKRGCVGC